MHLSSLRISSTVCALLLSVVAVFAADQVRQRDLSWVAPPESASKVNPLANKAGAEQGGAKIFKQRCSPCHGENASGTLNGPDLTQPGVQSQTDGALFWKITSGNTRQGMPSFSYVPEAQRWQVILWLRTQGHK